jgi:hypothetical protein
MRINGILQVNNKEYYLNYDINTLCMMEASGLDVMRLQNEHIGVETLRGLVYFGLCRFQPEITKEMAGEVISEYIAEGHTMEEFTDIVVGAIEKSLGYRKNKIEEQVGEKK